MSLATYSRSRGPRIVDTYSVHPCYADLVAAMPERERCDMLERAARCDAWWVLLVVTVDGVEMARHGGE